MHPCLGIEEILRCTFEFVYRDPLGPNRRSLANLAITCRTFLRPALESLWFHLPSLGPLVMCLPEDAWEERSGATQGPTLFLRRTLVTADWERPQLYAPLVKSCCPHPDPSSMLADVDAGVFRALRMCKPNMLVLPNLRVLAWIPNEDTKSDLDLFLTENLHEISLPPTPAMLVSLKQTCNHLRKLDIPTSNDPALTSPISDLVVHLPSLESINSNVPLTDDAIVYLSTSPNLEVLHIPNDAADFLRVLETNAPHPFFSTLVRLVVNAHDLTSVPSLLALCHLKKLQCLILTIQRAQVHDAERLFVELARSCSHDVLESIVLSTQNFYQLDPMPVYMLKHLFVFRRLWNMDLPISFDLDDNVVEQMAVSWPRMQQMDMNFPHALKDDPKITLRGLVSLVRHCRDLRRVTLVLNISSRDLASLRRDIEGLRNDRIVCLYLCGSWIDHDVNPAHVSSFLSALFPKLACVLVYSGRLMVVWAEINRHLLTKTQVMASDEA